MPSATIPDAKAASPVPAGAVGATVKAARILLVEDNRDILRATERLLTSQKYEVLTAGDGEEALRVARQHRPELILLDVMIPRVDGLEVCRQLKADPATSGIMIIHVTGRGSVDNRVQGFNAGADDYIPKPFHIPELLARIRSALRIKALTDDLAERNRQLLKSQGDLIQSEKMATIGLLAAGIAHEFNNIMAGISGYAQLARKDPKYRDKLVEVALTQTERAMELTRSLSTYNKVSGDGGVCDVISTIESALCLVTKEVESTNARIVTSFLERPSVKMSAGQLQEVVLNLVLNALQALRHDGGAIRIQVSPSPTAGFTALEVIDNGQGIAEEHIARIFDPFFTTKGALGGGRQSGTGLGLTVCYNLVNAAGGKIDVTSAVGKGSTFRLTLPLAATATAAAAPAEPGRELQPRAAPAPAAPRKLRILVVDDEVTIREMLREQLRGHDVVCCASGEAALEAYAVRPFDYVLLDVCIQRSMNGFQLFDRFARFTPPPRIIFASGRNPDPEYRSYLDRAHGHLLKPFKVEALMQLLGIPVDASWGGNATGVKGSVCAQCTGEGH